MVGNFLQNVFARCPHVSSRVEGMGFSAGRNFPTAGLFDGRMRASMEATGLGYAKEVGAGSKGAG
ncbi:phosphoenolpyruvate hydrolase family protein [Shumkonia mesophila]|uniref:phosphoenolpyruvate hydrolase family protein n=1 Tax=Shumkonia mesophila TaxID=2838854 RepID=UPI002934285B|nr:phosphoenolpyruvate hydrolase family protein [Shumkonia mesophila]